MKSYLAFSVKRICSAGYLERSAVRNCETASRARRKDKVFKQREAAAIEVTTPSNDQVGRREVCEYRKDDAGSYGQVEASRGDGHSPESLVSSQLFAGLGC